MQKNEESLFIDFITKFSEISNSQLFQDLFVLYETGFKTDGYFVEFGAYDGIALSNTRVLENFGWQGVLSEPNPRYFEKCKHNRSAKVDQRAVSGESGQLITFLDKGTISGFEKDSQKDRHGEARASGQRLTVQTTTFSELLVFGDAPNVIDYFSLDVEGAELEVLESIDFDKHEIRLITVEHNSTGDREKIFALLSRHGFRRKFESFSGHDDWYVNIKHRTHSWKRLAANSEMCFQHGIRILKRNRERHELVQYALKAQTVHPLSTTIKKALSEMGIGVSDRDQIRSEASGQVAVFHKRYFFNNNLSKPIDFVFDSKDSLIVMSTYWPEDKGSLSKDGQRITFERLPSATLMPDGSLLIENGSVWRPDERRAILFIGANTMNEIERYVKIYNRGVFIEPLPDVFAKLTRNLELANEKFSTDYFGVNQLVSSEDGKIYDFNVFSNGGASSSIFVSNEEHWKWDSVVSEEKIQLKSSTIRRVLDARHWREENFDVVLDVQGAELEVLKGFEDYLTKVNFLTVEVSQIPIYKGGVLFPELHAYLEQNNFQLLCDLSEVPSHGDAKYQNTRLV